jgi:photosystem II stability/assembly factor-like uncharacterized protein
MRPVLLALLVGAALALPARAGNLSNFDDAALNAVQFVDREEGWAVGDEGVVLHTIDGGRTWERQPTGERGSLRALHFLTPYTGWVVGREELPHGAGSTGILLFTQDGGLKWRRAARYTLPGLNQARFLDDKIGYVVGDGTEQFPTGVFVTNDSGRSWQPVPGPRCPGWLAVDFRDGQTGALAGAWSRLASFRQGNLAAADVDILGGRNLRGLKLVGDRAVAVGQGGLVLLSDTAGARWGYAEGLVLPPEVRAGWDFHAVCWRGEHIWVAGRPGSKVLHSADAGRTWETLTTGQPLPLHGLYFADEQNGWAVGDFGTVLNTADGGRTWRVQRRGGQRAAVLFVHARAGGLPVDTVALLGGQEGYLTVGVRVNPADPASADFGHAADEQRFAAAVRRAGGAAGEVLWQFPVSQHLDRAAPRDLLRTWDRLHADRAAEQLLRQLVLALRIWRPSVVITDHPDAQVTGYPTDALVAEALHEAFTRAADPKVFPEQIEALGLEPWQAAKLYGRWEGRDGAQVVLDLNEPSAALEAAPRDFAAPAAGLLADRPVLLPPERFYRLLDSRLQGAAEHRDLMEGVVLAPEGVARRKVKAPARLGAEALKVIRARRDLQALAETADGKLADPARLLAQIGPALGTLPDDQGAAAAFAVASQFVRRGQWEFAREAFLLMVDRYPAHSLSADAYRWLIRHNGSSEARRRHELGQFLMVSQTRFEASPLAPGRRQPLAQGDVISAAGVREVRDQGIAHLSDRAETRRWYQGSLEVGKRLAAFGPLFAADPSIEFCLQAARRQLGDFEGARQWYASFASRHPAGPWRDAAAAELWLAKRTGLPPKPAAVCRRTETRPFLDGKFDDSCWQGLQPLLLGNAVGKTAREYPTEAWLAHDEEYLYVALRCRHPTDRYVAPVKVRPRDADLRAFDRVSILLDLDRDYSTYFQLEVDQRGCVCDDCWGDPRWDPRWFVAVHSEPTCWQIEAAIPLAELTGDGVTVGSAWACNIVRVLPGRGVQAWSVPADVQPRPEGMGLLLFTSETKNQKPEPRPQRKAVMPAAETNAGGGK